MTRDDHHLLIDSARPVRAANGGLFVCRERGGGIHPTRIIDSHELIFVRSGQLGIRERDVTYRLAAGEHLILLPGCEHAGVDPYPPDLSFYWFHFHLPRRSRTGRDPSLRVALHGRPRRGDRLTEWMHRFLDDQKNQQLSPISANLLMTLMLCEAADCTGGDAASITPEHTLAARAESYIAAHADRPLSTSLIAEQLQCNPDYLGYVYRCAFGHTITQAIHRQRLRDARQLLLDSTLNIDQVARAAGFSSSAYFRRIFHRAEGLTPRQFRKLHLRLHINWR